MSNLPQAEQVKIDDAEARIFATWEVIRSFSEEGTDRPNWLQAQINTYARLYARIQLQRVAQALYRESNFGAARAVLDKAEEL